MKCVRCGAENINWQYKFCPNCGAKVNNDITTCFMCGKDL